jgi:hypothetical protein
MTFVVLARHLDVMIARYAAYPVPRNRDAATCAPLRLQLTLAAGDAGAGTRWL